MRGDIQGAPLESYSPEDQAFYRFWYGHMLGDLMQPPLADISHSTARYIWDAASKAASCHLCGKAVEPPEERRLLANLAALRKQYDDANPPLEEQGERAYMDWAYSMSDAWDEAYRYLGLPTWNPSRLLTEHADGSSENARSALQAGDGSDGKEGSALPATPLVREGE